MTPGETEPDVPASVGGSPAEEGSGCGSPWGQEQSEDETRNFEDPAWINTWHLKYKDVSGLILLPGEMLGNLPEKVQNIKCHDVI